jgi:hypothetical protein
MNWGPLRVQETHVRLCGLFTTSGPHVCFFATVIGKRGVERRDLRSHLTRAQIMRS